MAANTPIGYAKIANVISADGDLNIFRSFKELNVRNILYLQAEISGLEETLRELDEDHNDTSKGNDVWSVPRSWRSVKREDDEYLETVMRLRTLTEDYYRALRSQAWLLGLQPPRSRPRKNLMRFMEAHRSDMSQMDASFITDESNLPDLVALSYQEKEAMSEFIEKYLYKAFEMKGHSIETQRGSMMFFSEKRIAAFVRFLAILLSSILPILSIVVLYFTGSQVARLGLIVLFSAFCSTALAILSNAKNVEIIAATAAFAAVQVVFVSGSVGAS